MIPDNHSPNEFHLNNAGQLEGGLGPDVKRVPKRHELEAESARLEREAEQIAKTGDIVEARIKLVEAETRKLSEEADRVARDQDMIQKAAQGIEDRDRELAAREAKLKAREQELEKALAAVKPAAGKPAGAR